jgi:L-amino acid N-acyltransferase YncA
MLIRPADPARDADVCAAIYAPFVAGTAISFEAVPPTQAEFAARIERMAATHAFLVAVGDDGTVAGFAYGCPHRERAAYRWATEVSVYLADGCRGRGIGRALYAELLPRLGRRGYQVALAGVALPNDASLALHRACGFEPVGTFRRIGWKDGGWRDVTWLQLELVPAAPTPPPEPA